MRRILFVDFLRFLALILMLFSHANTILGIDYFLINQKLQELADSVCFIIFLFCFSIASSYIASNGRVLNVNKLFKRIGLFYLAYLVASVLAVIESNSGFNQVLKFALLLDLPVYGEFMIAFILFEFLTFFIQPILRKSNSSILSCLFIISILIYLAGNALSYTDSGGFSFVQHLIYGKQDVFSFPLTGYLPVYSLGLLFGYYFKKHSNSIVIKKILLTVLILIAITLILIFFGKDSDRWPPTLLFLSKNFLISLLMLLAVSLIFYIKKVGRFVERSTFFNTFVRNAIYFFPFHLIVLYNLKWVKFPQNSFITYVIVIVLPIIFVFLISKVGKKDQSKENQARKG